MQQYKTLGVYISSYIDRTSNPLGSLLIEGEARPHLAMHFCIPLVDIPADRNTVL